MDFFIDRLKKNYFSIISSTEFQYITIIIKAR